MHGRPGIPAALLAIALLTACAGTPSQPASQPPAPASTAAAPAATTAKATSYPGYKQVVKDGQTLYCSTDRTLGSWIKKDTVCMTEQELISAREQNQRSMMDISQKNGVRSN